LPLVGAAKSEYHHACGGLVQQGMIAGNPEQNQQYSMCQPAAIDSSWLTH
jgi:hypothetical protein